MSTRNMLTSKLSEWGVIAPFTFYFNSNNILQGGRK